LEVIVGKEIKNLLLPTQKRFERLFVFEELCKANKRVLKTASSFILSQSRRITGLRIID